MNKLRYLLIIALILSALNVVYAQDPCPFDQHLYEDEQKLMPDLTEFLAGKRYILPDGMQLKGYADFKYNPELLKKTLQNEEYDFESFTENLTDEEKAFYHWIVEYTKNRTDSDNNQLLPPSIVFELKTDWRMRGQKSQRPNDPEPVEFKVRKASVFKNEMSEALNISRDAEILVPKNFVENMFELLKSIEYSDFSQFKEFKAELFYAFGEVLTITGLKHNAFRAYLNSAELTKNADLHELAIIASREIKQSQRADYDMFEDDFIASQKEESQKFNPAFTEFAKEHKEFEDFNALKTTFNENYGSQNTLGIILLAGFGVLFIVMLIFFLKKSVG